MKILKIPLNSRQDSGENGVELAPDAVEMHLSDFHLNEKGMMPLHETEKLELDNANVEECHKKIEISVSKTLQRNEYLVLIGGDHSLTYASFRAFAKSNPGAGIILLDAHPNAKISQQTPTHENFLRALIEEGTLDAEKVVLVGCRNMNMQESKFLAENKIKNYSMREVGFEGLQEITDNAMSVAREWPSAYLSININILDPAFALGADNAETGGLTTRELIYSIQRFKLLRNIKIADLVEVNPKKDPSEMTAKIAAKIITELS